MGERGLEWWIGYGGCVEINDGSILLIWPRRDDVCSDE